MVLHGTQKNTGRCIGCGAGDPAILLVQQRRLGLDLYREEGHTRPMDALSALQAAIRTLKARAVPGLYAEPGARVSLALVGAALVPDSLVRHCEATGACLEVLDASWLAIMAAGDPTEAEPALAVTRAVLNLRAEQIHGVAIQVSVLTDDRPTAHASACDRALALSEPLAEGLRADAPLDGHSSPESDRAATGGAAHIRVDDDTAALVAARMQVDSDQYGSLVLAERADLNIPTLLGRSTPMCGRKRELASLLATVDECIEESVARAVLVVAPPGMGKSRLLREFWAELATRPEAMEVWVAKGDPVCADSPLGSLAQAVRWTANIWEYEPRESQRAKLRARIARSVPDDRVASLCAFASELIHAPAPDDRAQQVRTARPDARLMSEHIRRACAELLEADTRRSPVIFILEDLHWGDLATVGFLDQALRDLAERPLMVLALGRPEIQHRFPELWAAHDVLEMRLRPLSTRGAQRLVRSVLGDSIDDEQMSRLVRRADGSALYLEELVRSASNDQWELPETVVAMFQARLARLADAPRRALRAASIFGDRFLRSGVVALLSPDNGQPAGSEVDVDACLRALCDAEFIALSQSSPTSDEAEYWFRHDFIRQAAYGLETDEERIVGHRRAGRYLAREQAAEARVIAEHLERGDAHSEAVPFFRAAAESASNAGDFEVAVALSHRAVSCGPDEPTLGRIRAIQAEAHIWLQELGESAAAGEQALGLLEPGSRLWYEVAETVSWAQTRLGRIDALAARAALMSGGPSAHHDHQGWLILAASLSRWLLIDGRVELAKTLATEVERVIGDVETCELTRDPAVRARLHAARALYASVVDNNLAESLRQAELSARYYDESGDACRACMRHISTSYVQIELGLYAQATALLRPTIETARALGLEYLVDSAMQNLSVALVHQGALAEARELASRAAQSFEWREDARGATTSRLHLAAAWLADGEVDRAYAEARSALSWSVAETPRRVWALTMLARVELARGQPALALEIADQAQELADAIGSVELRGSELLLTRVEALDELGDDERARSVLTRAHDSLQARANKLDRDDWRDCYLHNVPAHARIIERYQRPSS